MDMHYLNVGIDSKIICFDVLLMLGDVKMVLGFVWIQIGTWASYRTSWLNSLYLSAWPANTKWGVPQVTKVDDGTAGTGLVSVPAVLGTAGSGRFGPVAVVH